jgi:hypothetical protein
MKIFNIINWRIALITIILSSVVSPYISTLYRGYVGLILLIGFSVLILLSAPVGIQLFKIIQLFNKYNKSILIAFLWFFLGIAFSFLRGANDYAYLIQVGLLPIYYYFGLFLSHNEGYHNYATLAIIGFVFINIIITGDSISSTTSAREIYNESDNSLTAGTTGFWGLIGILFPIFLAVVLSLKKTLLKTFYIIILFIIVYKLFFSGFATPVGLLLINLTLMGVLYFIYNFRKSSRFLRAFFVIFFFYGIAFFLLNTITQSQSSALADVQWRFNNFIENPQGGGYSGSIAEEESRFLLMQFSWNTFLKNPFFGGGGNIRTSIYEGISGGHSSAVDFLAVLGLLGGGGAFIYFVFIVFRNARKQLKRTKSFNEICHFASVITFIIGGIMNPYWQGPILASFLLIVSIYKNPENLNSTLT